ncbi:hypothetical protein [Rhizobium leguminosarum]|uniref:hypothetical protein n=1 Tax=Rhizobium leguminosarum TaxID=384 RepID=UPI001039B9CA|nr:hypothetical protein [Rhizobium leguminosarum]TBY80644.1 hypothetical protein E0H32_19785 [Rhizobium leguminosarum bv. viciae]
MTGLPTEGFSERAFWFNPLDDQHVVYFVKIEVEGRVVHFNRLRARKDFGVERDAGYVFFIARINAG